MKTPAEYQRDYRKRQKQKERMATNADSPVFREPFFEFYNDNISGDFDMAFDLMGIPWLEFTDDSDPKPLYDHIEPELYEKFKGSLGRAELLIDCLLMAAGEMAATVNSYKLKEIDARVAEIEETDLTDPAIKKQALADIAKLTRYRDELSKSVRWTLPQWKVTGE